MKDSSVTQWIQGLRGGDEEAAAQIWERFFQRACGLARQRFGDAPQAAHDAEDVALSAIRALCAGARDDRFRSLRDRDDLWSILAMLTIRRVIDARRHAQVRGRAIDWSEVEAHGLGSAGTAGELVPDAGYVDALCLTSREMLERLESKLRAVALLRLEGYSNEEVAVRTGRSLPTVERYLRMVRAEWQDA